MGPFEREKLPTPDYSADFTSDDSLSISFEILYISSSGMHFTDDLSEGRVVSVN